MNKKSRQHSRLYNQDMTVADGKLLKIIREVWNQK